MATDDAALIATLTELRTDWPVRAWSWDGRLPTATSAVTGEQIARAKVLLQKAMPQQFDATSIATAPPDVLAFVERSGGLRGVQLAFYAEVPGRCAVGLWWPWGGGATVSLRVGFVGAEKDPALVERLRKLFDVT